MVFFVMITMSLVLGVIAAGYMLLIASQHRLVSQSMNWNTALALAEAGVEEGMAQVNINFGTNFGGSAATNWSFNSTDQCYGPVTRTFTNGSYSAIIKLNGAGSAPSIIATGYAASLYNLPRARRIVCVDIANYSPWIGAMNTRLGTTTKGSGMMIDSFDSTDPLHSSGGMYNPATHLAGGDIASIGGSVDLQNCQVYGKLRLGVNATWSLGNGWVGDLTWSTVGQIQPGWLESDFNSLWKDVLPPFTGAGAPPSPGGSSTNAYILGSSNYMLSSLTINNGDAVLVNGNASLWVTGTINFKNAANTYIIINPGCSLKLYCGVSAAGSTNTSATLGTVITAGGASTFQYYGLPSNGDLTWTGNASYVGTIYAPNATFSMGGGGSTFNDFQGAVTCKYVDMNGHFNFHYDQALSRISGSGYSVAGWKEL